MAQLRIVLFGSGSPASCLALERLAGTGRVAAVVVPPRRQFAGQLQRLATKQAASVIHFGDLDGLRALEPDLFCVASFPRLLKSAVLAIPRLGAVNFHPSLLPRHRGPNPIFWTYFDDDRETGATIHWIDEGIDSGDVIAQSRRLISRGTSGVELYMELADEGARLLAEVVDRIANGTAARTPQDPALATHEPSPQNMSWHIDWESWPAERLWHFLRGIGHLGLPLVDIAGHGHRFSAAGNFRIVQHGRRPGEVVRSNSRLLAYTRDGWVELTPSTTATRLTALFRRLKASF